MATYFSVLGNESYLGTADPDTIHTGTGNDTITGGAGNDSLFGGTGTDTAVFHGSRDSYRIGWSANRGALTVTDLDIFEAGDEGTDVLVGIETLQFADGTYTTLPGGEVRVSQFVTSDHRYPVVAGLSGGGHVVTFEYAFSVTAVFEIDQAPFDAAGHFAGAFEQEDRVNTTTANDQQRPAVGALTGGGYVIAWQSYLQDGSSWGIYAQRFDAVGTPLGTESLVNTTATAGQRSPAVAGLNNGGYVVAWQALDGDGEGIFAQRFDANGTAVGTETRLNDATARSQTNPVLAGLADGGYVAVWDGTDVIESVSVYQGIWLRRFDAGGNPVAPEEIVNQTTASKQLDPAVAALSGGGFVVAWESFDVAANAYDIYLQRYAANGNRSGGETLVTATAGTQLNASLAATSDGGYVVAWEAVDANGFGIFFRRYDASGNAQTGETLVNTYTTANQSFPSVAGLSNGGFVVTWDSYNQGGSSYTIYSQSYGADSRPILPQVRGGIGDDPLDATGATHAMELRGNLGNDTLLGGNLGDILRGEDGDDRITGGLGADNLDGGLGMDTATYAGAKSGYTFVKVGTSYTVTDTNTADGDDGTDTLSGIEWLQFSDGATKLGRVLADTSGDGKSDLMWRNTDGSTSLWLMNGTSVQTYGSFGQIPTAWQIAASGDLNGDGKTDLMWRHSDGSTSLWLMNGTTVQSYGAFGQIPTPWQITTTGDFNGDGKTDLMWRHTDGSTSLWLMNGTVAQGYGSFGAIPTAWQITASGDFDGDGKTDLMWRHTDGSTSLWLMNGTVAQGFGSFGAIPVTWSILDSQGDYNGDGKNDLLWRNATDGSTNLWLMNGTTVQTYGSFGQVATGWNLVDGHGDYNGDGKSDLMWRHTDGSTSLWLMNGATVQTYGSFGAIPTAWSIVAAHEDYNSDGKSDILWRHTDGSTSLWLMNGTGVQTFGSFGAIPSTWNPVAGADAGATLTGDGSANSLTGTLNNDTLIGLAGNDILSGGAGADRFVFNTALNATTNVDTLTDFRSGTDRILLDHLILTALTTGTLAATSFVAEAGAVAHDGNDFILYNTTTGALSYDPDGTGAQAAVLFATLSGNPALSAADLAVI